MTSAPLQALIADDEPLAHEALSTIIAETPGWEVAAVCANGREAQTVLASGRHIDVAFLDIRMPPPTGLELATWVATQQLRLAIVFVTSHSEHALDAFDRGALDYVLKPFRPERIRRAMARAAERRTPEFMEEAVRWLRSIGAPEATTYLEFLTSTTAGKTRVVPINDIHALTAEDNYVRAHLAGGSMLVRGPLSGLLDRIDPRAFARTHRGAAVNLKMVRGYRIRPDGDYVAELASGSAVPVSRAFRDRFLAHFG